jgi:hypothetical protein
VTSAPNEWLLYLARLTTSVGSRFSAEGPKGQMWRGPQAQSAGGEMLVVAQAGGVGNPAIRVQEA